MKSFYVRALDAVDKEQRLLDACRDVVDGSSNDAVFLLENESLRSIPGKPLAYWCTSVFLEVFKGTDCFANNDRRAFVGLQTSDDFRFVRLNWEIEPEQYYSKWFPLAKGGEYLPYYSDIHLCVNWSASGYEIKNFRDKNGKLLSRPQNTDYYLRSGITWPERTTSGFCPQVLPEGVIFSQVGLAMFMSGEKDVIEWLLTLHTRIYQYIIELLIGLGEETVSGSAGRHYTSGMISKLPFPSMGGTNTAVDFQSLYANNAFVYRLEETSELFDPVLLLSRDTVAGISDEIEKVRNSMLESAFRSSEQTEKKIRSKFGIEDEDLADVFDVVGPHPVLDLEEDKAIANLAIAECAELSTDKIIDRAVDRGFVGRAITKKSFFVDRDIEVLALAYGVSAQAIRQANADAGFPFRLFDHKTLGYRVLSYLVGVAFGRFAHQKTSAVANSSVFAKRDPFRFLSKTMIAPKIFFSDSGECALSDRVIELIKEIFGGDASLSDDLASILGGSNINDLLNNPNAFFDFHLGQYSKSRRQSPVYWPLQSESGSYTLWVCYHDLSAQSLYSGINDFIEPTITRLNKDVEFLLKNTNRNRDQEKSLAELTSAVNELRDFNDDLLQIAKSFSPNLDDGVQIIAAPLWKFFRHNSWRKKLKETWEKLETGDYDWARLAMSYWPERVLLKCHEERSLAIAHAVEGVFWHEVEVPVMRAKKITGETKLEWQPKQLTHDELNTLIHAKVSEKGA